MVNYNLTLYGEKYSKQIDLSKITNLKETKKISCIDRITSQFNSQDELKIYLYNKGLIDKIDLNNKISVSYKYKNDIKNLEVIYKKHSKYLDPIYLSNKVKSMSNSITFLDKLAHHYDYGSAKTNPQTANVLDIKCYIYEFKKYGGNTTTTSLDIALNDLCIKAMHTKDKKLDKCKLNYRGLRDLGLFVYRFENTNNLESYKNNVQKNIQTSYEQLSLFDKRK